MVLENGYKKKPKKKESTIYVRMDQEMVSQVKEIRDQLGESMSGILREATRRLIAQAKKDGSTTLI